jgi:hypothetical protein
MKRQTTKPFRARYLFALPADETVFHPDKSLGMAGRRGERWSVTLFRKSAARKMVIKRVADENEARQALKNACPNTAIWAMPKGFSAQALKKNCMETLKRLNQSAVRL